MTSAACGGTCSSVKRSKNWSCPILSIGLGRQITTSHIRRKFVKFVPKLSVEVERWGYRLQAVELSQTAVQIVSNLPAHSNGVWFTIFWGKPAMRTRWMAGTTPHKSGWCRDQSRSDNTKQTSLDLWYLL